VRIVGHHDNSTGLHLIDIKLLVEFNHLEQEASGGFRLKKNGAEEGCPLSTVALNMNT